MTPVARTVEPLYGRGPVTLPTQISLTPSERELLVQEAIDSIRDHLTNMEGGAEWRDGYGVASMARENDVFATVATALTVLTAELSTKTIRVRHPAAIAGLHQLADGRIEHAWYHEIPTELELWRPLAQRLNVYTPADVHEGPPKPPSKTAAWKTTTAGRRWTVAEAA